MYSVDCKCFTGLFILNTNPFPRILCKGTCTIDLVLPHVRIGAVTELTSVPSSRPYDNSAHAERVRNALPAYLAEIEYPEISEELTTMLMQNHSVMSLPEDPLKVTTMVEHHIPLKPIYIFAYRFSHTRCKQFNKIVGDMLSQDVTKTRTPLRKTAPVTLPLTTGN